MKHLRAESIAFLALLTLSSSAHAAPSIAGGTPVLADDPIARTTVGLISVYPGEGEGKESYGLCTGSIIAKDFILTAAHCVEGAQKVALFFGTNMDAESTVRGAVAAEIHPGYVSSKMENDLALLQFQGDLPSGYQTIEFLPASTVLNQGDQVTIAGFGMTDLDKQEGSGLLRKVTEIVYGTNVREQNTIMFAHLPQTGACPGDSGGPALVSSGSGYSLLGVASYIFIPGEKPCGLASVYTDLRNESMSSYIQQAMDRMRKK
ncbi:MAG: hypothetical protein A2X94_16610 [Bdellovibrionales bacterium GWB1_55_8]|nr:MAG: hypothetical protein A2X94_16610 [Bdellovibrionales bacterium GWB1_55_8]